MYTSIIKKARVVEKIEGENPPEDSMSTPSQEEFLGNGDTEIFSTLIPMMEDVEVLKTCRLVCKSWNKFASLAMRKLPWAFFRIHEVRPEQVAHRLTLLAENENLGLPSPFSNFKVCATRFWEKSFLGFLKYLRDKENNKYSIDLRITRSKNEDKMDPAEFQTVLTTNLHNFKIIKLVLHRKINFGNGPHLDTFQPDKIRLQHLKTLEIKDNALANDRMVLFCQSLCQHSPLKVFKISNLKEGEKLKKVLSPEGKESQKKSSLKIPGNEEGNSGIQEFHFSYEKSNSGNWGKIIPLLCTAAKLLPNVSIFSVRFDVTGGLEFTGKTLNDIYMAAPQLTSLQLGVTLRNDEILSGMREIRVDDLEEAEGWALENLPRNVSLLDFPRLDTLDFGPNVAISRHMFIHCLSKMAQLKYLTFYLDGDVSVDDVREFTGHLKLITIMIAMESTKLDEKVVEGAEGLRVMLPSGGEIRTKILKNPWTYVRSLSYLPW